MSTTPLGPASTVVAASDQVSADLEDETVVLSLRSGEYYGLNEVAARVWALVDERRTVASVVDQLVEEYEVARDVCEAEVVAVLGQMLEWGLLEVGSDE